MKPLQGEWDLTSTIQHKSFTCGYCGQVTGTKEGYVAKGSPALIYVCGGCNRPTFFEEGLFPVPAPVLGHIVEHLPVTIEPLYEEARRCTQVRAYTACVLACRKILMNVAVEKGAKEGLQFLSYVDYLAEKGYVPPDGKGWVDHIRKKGNEATHEIVPKDVSDARELLSFAEMLLKFVYEFPARIVPPPASI